MRRITLWLLTTLTALVLLFSYRTSTIGAGSAPQAETAIVGSSNSGSQSSSGTGSPSAGSQDTGSADTGSQGSSGSGGSKSSTSSGTYEGTVAQTRWGPVQVVITVADGKITNVDVPTYPDGNHRDVEINAYALPVLNQETMDAQSARIDTVSGATVTSDGYRESLQAAIDQAHLS